MKFTRRVKALELVLTPPPRRHIPFTAEQRERAIRIINRRVSQGGDAIVPLERARQ